MLFKRPVVSHRRGAAAVEMAFALPLLLLLLVGIWEVGRMVEAQQIVSNAAREGARQAATGRKSYDEIRTMILAHLDRNGIRTDNGDPSDPQVNVKISIRNLTTADGGSAEDGQPGNYDPQNAEQLEDIEVTVEVPYANVQWVFIDRWFFHDADNPDHTATGAGSEIEGIRGRAQWASMKDIPITVDTSIPQKPVN
jgi:Flp pilus assembly protein TadG